MPRNITLFMTLLFATVALMLVGARPRGSVAGTGIPDVAGTWQGTWSHRHGSGRIRPPRSKEEFFYGKKNGHATPIKVLTPFPQSKQGVSQEEKRSPRHGGRAWCSR
jgi:hypothetical protein